MDRWTEQRLDMSVDDAVVLLALLTLFGLESPSERPTELNLLLARRIDWLKELLLRVDRSATRSSAP